MNQMNIRLLRVDYVGKEGRNLVNIFQKYKSCVTVLLSMYCNTHCFTLQKCLFYTPKVPVLQRKTGTFVISNRYYRFFKIFSLQNNSSILQELMLT